MMNTQIPQEQWKVLKHELELAWDEISAEEIERTHGSVKSIYGLVHKNCGLHQEEVKAKLENLLAKYDRPEVSDEILVHN